MPSRPARTLARLWFRSPVYRWTARRYRRVTQRRITHLEETIVMVADLRDPALESQLRGYLDEWRRRLTELDRHSATPTRPPA